MGVHLVTGYQGKGHIQSKDARAFNMALFGFGEFVMENGNMFEASIINNNTVRVIDGDILMQGGHIRLDHDMYEDLTIQTGTAGKNRNDLIVMTYEKDAVTGVESAKLEVVKGTETTGTASDPDVKRGILSLGDLKNQMPLYRVKISGVVLSELEPLFEIVHSYKTLAMYYVQQFVIACQTHLNSLNVLDTLEEVEANTEPNNLAGALATKELSAKVPFRFGVDEKGNYGYIKAGADTVIPFRHGGIMEVKTGFCNQHKTDAISFSVENDGIATLNLTLQKNASAPYTYTCTVAKNGSNINTYTVSGDEGVYEKTASFNVSSGDAITITSSKAGNLTVYATMYVSEE